MSAAILKITASLTYGWFSYVNSVDSAFAIAFTDAYYANLNLYGFL